MPTNYEKDKDIFIQRRSAGNTRFEESPLIVSPDSVVGIDSANDLVMIPLANFAQGTSASYAKTASVALNVPETSSYSLMGLSSSYAETATYAITTSYETSSFIITTVSADFAIVAFFADTASWASSSLSSSISVYAETASYALNAAGGSSESSSWASSSLSSSYTITSSFADTASFALNVIGNSPSSSWASSSISSSYSFNSSNSDTSSYSITTSYADYSTTTVTSSYAITASYALNGGGSAALTSSAQTTGSYTLVSDDNGKVITFENATTNSIVIPASLPTNFNCFLVSVSTGSVQVTGSGGIQLNNANNCFKLSGRYAAASIVGYLPEKYILFGDVSL